MKLEPLVTYPGSQGPVLLIIADGVGSDADTPANAVTCARTPNLDSYHDTAIYTELKAHGTAVGLPSDNDMGNSEVGHNTLGGGRVFDQGAKLVNNAISNGTLFVSEHWNEIISRGISGQTVHFIGLLSDGNVHSHIDHLFALIDACKASEVNTVRLHILLDGRDVGARSALQYVTKTEEHLSRINCEGGFDYRIASGGGRMVVTMDRYQADWKMVKRGYYVHVHGIGKKVRDCADEIRTQYESDTSLTDQTLEPFVVVDKNDQPVGTITDGDAVVLFNFRGDRSIEISQALEYTEFSFFERGDAPDVYFCGMLQYDGDLNIPSKYLINPPLIERTMGEFMCDGKIQSFAISETQKYGHVTYFWNGNRSGYIDEMFETYVEIPSDNVAFNEKPEMKARAITAKSIELLESNEYHFGRINFANADMVGHTGDFDATVTAVETVDACIGELVDCVSRIQGIVIITSDHGNADKMFSEKDSVRQPHTAHTLNPVPFYIIDNRRDDQYRLSDIENPGLANVAATVFNLLGYRAPIDYYPSLIKIDNEPRDRKTLYSGSLVNLGLETALLPNEGLLALEVVRHPGGAVIVALDDKQHVCLLKQFRHAAGGWIWECPAGVLEKYEDNLTAAQRELHEEAGCKAGNWLSLGTIFTSPGFCSERLHIYLAQDLEKGDPHPEQHEFIETHWIDLEEALKMVHDGHIEDAKSIIGLYKAWHALRPTD